MLSSLHKQIRERISVLPEGSVFTVTDFCDIAEPKTVSKTLERLKACGSVEKILRGVFKKEKDKKTSPDKVAHALARENLWHLVPCGETALHILGVTDKEPEVWTYVTDGTYRKYEYDGVVISFLHSSGKALKTMSERSALLVQAIKAYGKEHISDDCLEKIRSCFENEEINRILIETRNSTEWVYKTIKRMFQKKVRTSV